MYNLSGTTAPDVKLIWTAKVGTFTLFSTLWILLTLSTGRRSWSLTLAKISEPERSVVPSSVARFATLDGPPRCTRTYEDDGVGTSAVNRPNLVFSSVLTLKASTLERAMPINSMNNRFSIERPTGTRLAGAFTAALTDPVSTVVSVGGLFTALCAFGLHWFDTEPTVEGMSKVADVTGMGRFTVVSLTLPFPGPSGVLSFRK